MKRVAMLTFLSLAGIAALTAWRMEYRDGQVNAVISCVRCSWSPERLGDIVVIGTVANPSSLSRDFELTAHVSVPGLGDRALDGGSLVLAAGASRHFGIEHQASADSHGSRMSGCRAAARSFTPGSDD